MEHAPASLPDLDALIRVEDLRLRPRFVVHRPLQGALLGERTTVRDLSAAGFGLSHSARLKVGSVSRLNLEDPEFGETIPFRIRLVWSHLSGNRDDGGALLYDTGAVIVDDLEPLAGKLGRLIHFYGTQETASLEVKKTQALARLMKRVAAEKKLLLDLDPAELLQSYRALSGARDLSEEEKMDLVRDATETLAATGQPGAWNRDILAAWRSIDGKIELKTIESARRMLAEIDRFVHSQQAGG